ncbi:MAG: redoxin domain-containing protein [Planctomycetes bacterium]|nr:redoxin domain-containing protein [Planctomycetota bacterium]
MRRCSNAALFILVATVTLVGCAEGEDTPPELSLPLDLDGRPVDVLRQANTPADVLLFVSTDCPIANRYAPELRRIHDRFAPRGIVFWLVYVDPSETVEEIRRHLKEYLHPGRPLRDRDHQLVGKTGATKTPEAAVMLPDGQMVYRGRIDDRFVDFGKVRAAPSQRDLENVLQAIVEGRTIAATTTTAVGCFIPELP